LIFTPRGSVESIFVPFREESQSVPSRMTLFILSVLVLCADSPQRPKAPESGVGKCLSQRQKTPTRRASRCTNAKRSLLDGSPTRNHSANCQQVGRHESRLVPRRVITSMLLHAMPLKVSYCPCRRLSSPYHRRWCRWFGHAADRQHITKCR